MMMTMKSDPKTMEVVAAWNARLATMKHAQLRENIRAELTANAARYWGSWKLVKPEDAKSFGEADFYVQGEFMLMLADCTIQILDWCGDQELRHSYNPAWLIGRVADDTDCALGAPAVLREYIEEERAYHPEECAIMETTLVKMEALLNSLPKESV